MKIDPSTHPVSWFRDRSLDGSLFLKPPYQRKSVWKKSQKAYLIDSILKGYQLPEVYIHRETNGDGKSIYNVVDGQQRIRTILEFIAGEIELDEEYTPEFSGQKFDDLPETIRQKFWSYTVYTRDISDATEGEVREFFKRMNRNVVSLNPQELRHATYGGDFIQLMESLAEDTFWTENKIVSPSEVRRMADVQYISELFVEMMNGAQDKTKDLDNFYEKYERSFPNKSAWHQRFLVIKTFIEEILPDLRNTRWRNKPDFYTLFSTFDEFLAKKKGFSIGPERKRSLTAKLAAFAETVAKAVEKEGKVKLTKDQKHYVNAVVKATTDKSNRVARQKILKKILTPELG